MRRYKGRVMSLALSISLGSTVVLVIILLFQWAANLYEGVYHFTVLRLLQTPPNCFSLETTFKCRFKIACVWYTTYVYMQLN